MELPETFPSMDAVLPRFKELVDEHRAEEGSRVFPDGVSARALLQQATRDTLTGMGLDVSGLTDAQMSDNHGWVLFPNFFMTIRAGEAMSSWPPRIRTAIRTGAIWHIASFMWLPQEIRESRSKPTPSRSRSRAATSTSALQQDYEQMPRQQLGLRNNRLDHMSLVKEEVVIAHYHSVIDRYMNEPMPSDDAEIDDVADHYSGICRTVLEYCLTTGRLVDEAKPPAFTEAGWAPLADLIDTEAFLRVGNFKEEMAWAGVRRLPDRLGDHLRMGMHVQTNYRSGRPGVPGTRRAQRIGDFSNR